MNTNLDELDDINSQNEIKSCKYYTSEEFVSAFESIDDENCDNNSNTSVTCQILIIRYRI